MEMMMEKDGQGCLLYVPSLTHGRENPITDRLLFSIFTASANYFLVSNDAGNQPKAKDKSTYIHTTFGNHAIQCIKIIQRVRKEKKRRRK